MSNEVFVHLKDDLTDNILGIDLKSLIDKQAGSDMHAETLAVSRITFSWCLTLCLRQTRLQKTWQGLKMPPLPHNLHL